MFNLMFDVRVSEEEYLLWFQKNDCINELCSCVNVREPATTIDVKLKNVVVV